MSAAHLRCGLCPGDAIVENRQVPTASGSVSVRQVVGHRSGKARDLNCPACTALDAPAADGGRADGAAPLVTFGGDLINRDAAPSAPQPSAICAHVVRIVDVQTISPDTREGFRICANCEWWERIVDNGRGWTAAAQQSPRGAYDSPKGPTPAEAMATFEAQEAAAPALAQEVPTPERAAWLLHDCAHVGRLNIAASQYVELQTEARRLKREHAAALEAGERILVSLGEYIRQSMHFNPEWKDGIDAMRAMLEPGPKPSARWWTEREARHQAQERVIELETEVAALRSTPTGAPGEAVCSDPDCPYPEHLSECPPPSEKQWEHLARIRATRIDYWHHAMHTAREERDGAIEMVAKANERANVAHRRAQRLEGIESRIARVRAGYERYTTWIHKWSGEQRRGARKRFRLVYNALKEAGVGWGPETGHVEAPALVALLAGQREALAAELKTANHWRERWCKEDEAHAKQAVENWDKWKAAERERDAAARALDTAFGKAVLVHDANVHAYRVVDAARLVFNAWNEERQHVNKMMDMGRALEDLDKVEAAGKAAALRAIDVAPNAKETSE